MKKLKLTYTQRIHLFNDIRQQNGNAGALRAWWRLEDLFSLSAEEKTAIKFQTRIVEMQEVYVWDASTPLPDKEFELDSNDVARTKHALTTAVHRGQDRVWLEPLLAQLDA
jgi:hypothetical protein